MVLFSLFCEILEIGLIFGYWIKSKQQYSIQFVLEVMSLHVI